MRITYASVMASYEPAELARELGYMNEARPGKFVRDYLRATYPDHPKHQRWVLVEDQADDVRANVSRNSERRTAVDGHAAWVVCGPPSA